MTRTVQSVLVLAMALVASPATAQSRGDRWEFTIAPYLVGAGIDGSVSMGALESDVDVAFDQIIDNLEAAFMGHFDARNGRWLLSSDVFFVDLEDSVDVAGGSATASIEETLWEVAGGYRVSPSFTVLVGARWVHLSTALRYSGPFVDERTEVGTDWVDPFVGAHLLAPLGDRWWLGLHGDIGGFGIGSDLAWQAYADIGWKASGLVSVILGYRAIDMDYEEGSGRDRFHYDLTIAGPQLAIAFAF